MDYSHAAILARTMNLPAITGVAIRDEWDGREAVLDGENGLLIVDPDFAGAYPYSLMCRNPFLTAHS